MKTGIDPELKRRLETSRREVERIRSARLVPTLSSDPVFCIEIAEAMNHVNGDKILIHCVDDKDNLMQHLRRLDIPIGAVIVDIDDGGGLDLADWLVDLDVPAGCLKVAVSEYRSRLVKIRTDPHYMELFRYGKGSSIEPLHDLFELRSLRH